MLSPNAPCAIVSQKIPYTCQFGVRAAIADRTIALVGDSHAAHWRGAIEVVAQARRWRGYSVTRSGCPLSTAQPDLAEGAPRRLHALAQRRHLLVSPAPAGAHGVRLQLAGLDVRAPRGTSEREHAVQGYLKAWRRLPQDRAPDHRPARHAGQPRRHEPLRRSARWRPRSARASRARSRARSPCSAIRPPIAAQRRGRDRRVRLVDLTPYMCSSKLCFPVVGGVLVHKDKTHLTPLFAGTLGPFLLQRVSKMFS